MADKDSYYKLKENLEAQKEEIEHCFLSDDGKHRWDQISVNLNKYTCYHCNMEKEYYLTRLKQVKKNLEYLEELNS